MPLHLTKVAFGCASVEVLAERIAARTEGGEAPVWTRYKPTRDGEVIGGSLFWIIKHRLVARQSILGFRQDEDGKRWVIRVADRVVPVRAIPKRAHQGWRYLADEAAPADLSGLEEGELAALPLALAFELSALALI